MIVQNNFPREVGPPRKLVFTKKEFYDYVDRYNGYKTAVYSSIYHFDSVNVKPNYDSAVITCLFFDFDDKECDSYNEVKKLHMFCLQEKIKHKIFMSGRGYHCYIYTQPYRAKSVKGTIYNAQHYFIDRLGLKIDTHVVGNPAQMARVPNTWNGKANLFCVPVTQKDIDMGDKSIRDKAKNQSKDNELFGENDFELSKYDYEPQGFDLALNAAKVDAEIENLNVDFPPCLLEMIKRGDMRWKERYLLILYLKEKGYSKKNVYDILNEICSIKRLSHCVNEERQLQYLFFRDDLVFPSCNKIRLDGYCPGKCPQYEKVIYK